MAAQEKNIKLLQELLVRIEARRRKQDGSIPEGVQVSLMEAAEPSAPEEEIPYMPEEFEVKAEAEPAAGLRLVPAPPASEPTEELDISPELIEAAAEQEAGPAPSQAFEEEEVGEVTDKVQVIPPIPARFEEATVPEKQIAPQPKLVPEEEAAVELEAEAEFPEIEAEVAVQATEVAVPEAEAPVAEVEAPAPAAEVSAPATEIQGPTILEGASPIKEARPFQTTGQPVIIPKPTIGQLLKKAFEVGEHREEE